MSARRVAGSLVLVLVVAGLVTVAAYVLSTRQTKQYAATTVLLFSTTSPELQALGVGFTPDPTDVDVRVANEAKVLGSFELAAATRAAVPALGLSANRIHDDVTASPERGTEVVDLTATADTPRKALTLVDAYYRAYRRSRQVSSKSRTDRALRALKQRLAALPQTQARGQLGAQLRAQEGALTILRTRGTNTPEVIERARLPTSITAPRTRRNVLFGVLLGLLLGIGLVALRAELRRQAGADPSST